jgi:predicted nuclease of predicted toxin-antitoxin system
MTADKDFGELVFWQRRVMSSIVLIRLAGLTPQRTAEVVADAIEQHGPDLLQAFAVISLGTIRVRKQRT